MAGLRGLCKLSELREATQIGKAAVAAGLVVALRPAAPDGTVRAVIKQRRRTACGKTKEGRRKMNPKAPIPLAKAAGHNARRD